MKKKQLIVIMVLAIVMIVGMSVDGVSQPACEKGDPNNPVPLDSAIVILLIAGALYGAYRVYKNSRMTV